MLRMSRYCEALSKIGGRRWTEARNVIDTQEEAATSKSGEACYDFYCIFRFASSLGQSDMFSLAGYSDMKIETGNIPPLDDNDPSLH
jgi:hypothetical protein